MLYLHCAYAYGDDRIASGSYGDLSVGGMPREIPGPAAASSYTVATSSYRCWHPNERLTRQGGPTQVCEITIFDAADAFRYEFNLCYPRCARFQLSVATLMAVLSAFAACHLPAPQVGGEVLAGSFLVVLLARVYVETCAHKGDCQRD